MKTCSKCKVEQPFSCFSKDKSKKDGLQFRCKSCDKAYREANREAIPERKAKCYRNKREYYLQKRKEYVSKNSEAVRESKQKYWTRNKERLNAKRKANHVKGSRNAYYRSWKASTPLNKLGCSIRSNVKDSFKRGGNNWSKPTSTEQILGIKIKDFVAHIETLLKPGMTLENHGEWHLDHVIPLARAKTEQDVKMLCHYTNYQPLWAEDNLSKKDK